MEGPKVIDMNARRRAKAAAHGAKRKTELLTVKMTAEDKARIADLAATEEKTMSAYVREIVLKLARGWSLAPPPT